MTAPIANRAFPPIRFRAKPYHEFCRNLDHALAMLEQRYPSHARMLTIDDRNKKLRRRPK